MREGCVIELEVFVNDYFFLWDYYLEFVEFEVIFSYIVLEMSWIVRYLVGVRELFVGGVGKYCFNIYIGIVIRI